MELQKAREQDINTICSLIVAAKAFLNAHGIDQWQTGYPSRADIAADIVAGTGWLFFDGQAVVGYVCIDFGGEPAYAALQGEWLDAAPYAVIHRLAFAKAYRGRGLAKDFFVKIAAYISAQAIYSIRVDTDADNMIMKHLLDSLGYVYCGKIWFDNSAKLAYQKQLKHQL